MSPGADSVRRFDGRVENYDRFRPGYPDEIVARLQREAGLPAAGRIADLGAGTGKLAEVFLRAGYAVVGVEPNDAMRAAAAASLGGRPGFSLVAGTAEAVPLPDGSVDAVVAGQAFHWFEPRAARRECRRILAPGGGVVALIWNDRCTSGSPLLADYEELLRRHSPEYAALQRGAPDEAALAAFFAPCAMAELHCGNRQELSWEGLLGRVLSASYVPLSGPAHDALVAGLRASFERNARDGRVTLPYDTRLFVGRLDAD